MLLSFHMKMILAVLNLLEVCKSKTNLNSYVRLIFSHIDKNKIKVVTILLLEKIKFQGVEQGKIG